MHVPGHVSVEVVVGGGRRKIDEGSRREGGIGLKISCDG